ncbi:MAG: hypothetical protein HWN81_20995 [Candidatus Lokiarchaeota archaeon]|nr:hypothetical protein [Candidatus Lokiarchaeota archaeon]
MGILTLILYPILYVISIITGTLIARSIAKNNEWDISYKTAFIVIFIWMTITFGTSLIIQLATGNLAFSENDNFLSISLGIIILIISFSTFLIIGPFIVKKFYEEEFRESFSMTMRILLYQSLIYILFFPLFYI